MNVAVTVGDVLETSADVLISTANPWLNMSGGVNGAIHDHDSSIQAELRDYLKSIDQSAISASSVVQTSAGVLPYSHIIHAVAIDPFYDSSHEIVANTLTAAFQLAVSLDAQTIAMPTLATGYGPMTIEAFAQAFAGSVIGRFPIETVTIVVRSQENAQIINAVLSTLT